MNHEAVNEHLTVWLEPARQKFMRAVNRSSSLRLSLLVLVNAAGCLLVLSPLIILAAAAGTVLVVMTDIQGPLDLLLVAVLGAASLLSLFLSIQLHLVRPARPQGVLVEKHQAVDLFGMLERRISHFRMRTVSEVLLTTEAELTIRATPRWPVPVWHTYSLCVGAPLMYFISHHQLRLALAGAIAATARKQNTIAGWAIQATTDWPAIIEAFEANPSQVTNLLLKPLYRIREITGLLSKDLRAESQQAQTRWVLENTNEKNTMEYLSCQVVAMAYLEKQYWPTILKGAERCASPVVKPFSHFELFLKSALKQELVKRWLLQAQAISGNTHGGMRDLMADLGIDHLQWSELPQSSAFQSLFNSADILSRLDENWQGIIEPEWNERHRAFQREKLHFENLHRQAEVQNLSGEPALRYVQLTARFLDRTKAILVYRKMYRSNPDNAALCFACGREMLLIGYPEEAYEALRSAAELDKSLAGRVRTLIADHKQTEIKRQQSPSPNICIA
ncbi:hypothetical protein [Thiogranum longum]